MPFATLLSICLFCQLTEESSQMIQVLQYRQQHDLKWMIIKFFIPIDLHQAALIPKVVECVVYLIIYLI